MPRFPGELCAQSCLTLCNRMDGGLPGSCVHRVSGAREKPRGPFLSWGVSEGDPRPGGSWRVGLELALSGAGGTPSLVWGLPGL